MSSPDDRPFHVERPHARPAKEVLRELDGRREGLTASEAGRRLVEQRLDMPLDLARTVAVNTLVFGQAFYLFNSRFLHESSLRPGLLFANRVAWLAVGALALLQFAFVYAPFMQRWFGSAALAPRHWLVPLGIGLGVFLVVEAEKALLRRFRAAAGSPRGARPSPGTPSASPARPRRSER